MTIRDSQRALSQLASLHEYLAARNPSAEANVGASIGETIGRLRELPLLGKRTDEPRVHLLVEAKYRYRVFYRVEGETICKRRGHPTFQGLTGSGMIPADGTGSIWP